MVPAFFDLVIIAVLAVIAVFLLAIVWFLHKYLIWCFRRWKINERDKLASVSLWLFAIAVLLAAHQLYFWFDMKFYHDDRRYIDTSYIHYQQALLTGKLEEAYSSLSPNYRSSHSIEDFKHDATLMEAKYFPLDPGRQLKISRRKASLSVFEGGGGGPIYQFEKYGKTWYLSGESMMIPD